MEKSTASHDDYWVNQSINTSIIIIAFMSNNSLAGDGVGHSGGPIAAQLLPWASKKL